MYTTEREALKDLDSMIQSHTQAIRMLAAYATQLKQIKGDVDAYYEPDLKKLFDESHRLAMEMDDVLQQLRELQASMDIQSGAHDMPCIYGPPSMFGLD